VSGSDETAEALWYVGPGRAEIREERLKPLTDDKVRVRALYGAISRGTEALIAAGRVPAGEYQRMRGLGLAACVYLIPLGRPCRARESVHSSPAPRQLAARPEVCPG